MNSFRKKIVYMIVQIFLAIIYCRVDGAVGAFDSLTWQHQTDLTDN